MHFKPADFEKEVKQKAENITFHAKLGKGSILYGQILFSKETIEGKDEAVKGEASSFLSIGIRKTLLAA